MMEGMGRGRQATLPAWMTQGVGKVPVRPAALPVPETPQIPNPTSNYRASKFMTGANSITPRVTRPCGVPVSNDMPRQSRVAAPPVGRDLPPQNNNFYNSADRRIADPSRPTSRPVRGASLTRLRYRSDSQSETKAQRERSRERNRSRKQSSSSSSRSSSSGSSASRRRKHRKCEKHTRKSKKRRRSSSTSTSKSSDRKSTSSSRSSNKQAPNASLLCQKVFKLRLLSPKEKGKAERDFDDCFCERGFYGEDTEGKQLTYDGYKKLVYHDSAEAARVTRRLYLEASEIRSFCLEFERDQAQDKIVLYECKNSKLTSVYMFRDKYRLVSPNATVTLEDIKESSVYRRVMKYAVKKGLSEDATHYYSEFLDKSNKFGGHAQIDLCGDTF